MEPPRKFISGAYLSFLIVLTVFGSLTAALAEGGSTVAPQVIVTSTPSTFATPQENITLTPAPIFTFTPIPSPSNCHPEGWTAISILPGDTLDTLAETFQSTPQDLAEANCLLGTNLILWTIFYIPNTSATAAASQTSSTACSPPEDWVHYTVQPNDNLTRLSIAFGVSVNEIQYANCMGDSTFLRAGKQIYVPTRIPVPSSTPHPLKTPTPIP